MAKPTVSATAKQITFHFGCVRELLNVYPDIKKIAVFTRTLSNTAGAMRRYDVRQPHVLQVQLRNTQAEDGEFIHREHIVDMTGMSDRADVKLTINSQVYVTKVAAAGTLVDEGQVRAFIWGCMGSGVGRTPPTTVDAGLAKQINVAVLQAAQQSGQSAPVSDGLDVGKGSHRQKQTCTESKEATAAGKKLQQDQAQVNAHDDGESGDPCSPLLDGGAADRDVGGQVVKPMSSSTCATTTTTSANARSQSRKRARKEPQKVRSQKDTNATIQAMKPQPSKKAKKASSPQSVFVPVRHFECSQRPDKCRDMERT